MGKTDDEILKLLNQTPLTLIEIAEKLEKKPKVIFRSLRKLFQKGAISRSRIFNLSVIRFMSLRIVIVRTLKSQTIRR